MTGPSGAAPAPSGTPGMLGRRTLRVVLWLWLASVVLCAVGFGLRSEWYVSAAALVYVTGALLALLPALFFVVRAFMHRGRAGHGVRLRHVVMTVAGVLSVLGARVVIRLSAGTKGPAYEAEMKADLGNLVTAEEAFKADSGRFGPRARLLWDQSAGDSVTLAVSADGRGWWAVATNRSSLARCGVWVGVRPPDGMHGAKESEPRCW